MSAVADPAPKLRWPDAKKRRDAKRAAGTCINAGPTSKILHGEVVLGGKCAGCVEVWRKSK